MNALIVPPLWGTDAQIKREFGQMVLELTRVESGQLVLNSEFFFFEGVYFVVVGICVIFFFFDG